MCCQLGKDTLNSRLHAYEDALYAMYSNKIIDMFCADLLPLELQCVVQGLLSPYVSITFHAPFCSCMNNSIMYDIVKVE